MVQLTKYDFLSEVLKNIYDVEFQFVGPDEESTEPSSKKRKTTKKSKKPCEKEKPEVFKAHKLFLSCISPIFYKQFFGSLHDRGLVEIVDGMEIVRIKEFSLQAFAACINHEYGEENMVKDCTDFDLLFEMILVCKKYDLDELSQVIMRRILKIKITRENLFSTLKVLEQFKGLLGFEKLCAELNRMCIVATFKNFSKIEDVFEFWSNNRSNKDYLYSFFDKLSEKNARDCTNCNVEECLDGKSVFLDDSKVGLKVRLSGSKDVNLTGVVTKKVDNFAYVKFKLGIEDNIPVGTTFSFLSYHCRDYIVPMDDERVCSNCKVESRCLAGKMFLPKIAPVVGIKLKLSGTERSGIVSSAVALDAKDKWGAELFEIDVEYSYEGRVLFTFTRHCSSNLSHFSYDC